MEECLHGDGTVGVIHYDKVWLLLLLWNNWKLCGWLLSMGMWGVVRRYPSWPHSTLVYVFIKHWRGFSWHSCDMLLVVLLLTIMVCNIFRVLYWRGCQIAACCVTSLRKLAENSTKFTRKCLEIRSLLHIA